MSTGQGSMRREFPRPVKAKIVLRATNERGQVACEGCGLVLGKRPYHIDHTIPDALFLDKSRDLTPDDGKLLGVECCHKPKTKNDIRQIRKADRQSYGDKGIRSRSTFPCGRNTPWKRTMAGKTVRRDAR